MACVWQCPSHLEFRERLHFRSTTLVTCLGAKSCPGRCISNSSCIVSRGTQVWTVRGWVGPVSCCVRWQWVDKLGVIRCKHFVLVGSCSAPFLLYRLFIEGKLLMIPWTKTSEKEATSLLSQVQHILNVEISVIERVILSLTISNQNYFEEMRAI